jgi:hypothetical protein
MKYFKQEIPIGNYLYESVDTPKEEITREHALHLAGHRSSDLIRGETWIKERTWKQDYRVEGNHVIITLQP